MAENMDAQINKILKPILKTIHENNITLNRDEAKINVKIVEDTVIALIEAMKKADPVFKYLYNRIVCTGSYYEGLRVKKPTEFDLNLVIRFPSKLQNYVEIESLENAPGFVRLKLKKDVMAILSRHNPQWYGLEENLCDYFDEDRVLSRKKIQSWIQGVMARAPVYFEKPDSVEKLLPPSASGPAFTYIIHRKQTKIDVDLVPVIEGTPYSIPSNIRQSKRFEELISEAKQTWFMVPKPYKGFVLDDSNVEAYWRISFPEAEKRLLKLEYSCVKMLIKLFKLIRDRNKWDFIASYYIKTIFLHELDKTTEEDWKEDNLGTIFLKMFRILKASVQGRWLSYYFNKDCNLLSWMHRDTANNVSSRMDNIIKNIEKTPENILRYFPE